MKNCDLLISSVIQLTAVKNVLSWEIRPAFIQRLLKLFDGSSVGLLNSRQIGIRGKYY